MIKNLFSLNIDKIFYLLIGLILGLILCSIGFISFILGILTGILLSIISSCGIVIFVDKYKLGVFSSLNNLKYINGYMFFTGIGLSGIVGSIIFQRT